MKKITWSHYIIKFTKLWQKGFEYYNFRRIQWEKEEENTNKTDEEIKAEIKEEIKNNMNILKKENIKYYQIDDAKNKELEQIFNKINLKIIFPSKARILRDGKFYTISKGCFTIYKEKFYNKLFEIKIRGSDKITSVIELDNKDIIYFKNEQLIIYRLKDGKYSLFQKIKESRVGYELQFLSSGCSGYPKDYRTLYIKEISGNRFISVSNYGLKYLL